MGKVSVIFWGEKAAWRCAFIRSPRGFVLGISKRFFYFAEIPAKCAYMPNQLSHDDVGTEDNETKDTIRVRTADRAMWGLEHTSIREVNSRAPRGVFIIERG